jgi:hypothetical protein
LKRRFTNQEGLLEDLNESLQKTSLVLTHFFHQSQLKIQLIYFSTAYVVGYLLRSIAAGAHNYHIIVRPHTVKMVNARQVRYGLLSVPSS